MRNGGDQLPARVVVVSPNATPRAAIRMAQQDWPAPTVRTLVELLDEEAPPEVFEEQLRVAREEGASPEVVERLRVEVVAALRVRSKLARHHLREAELRALYETATDLTGIRDVDAVLAAIVRRARMLLGADLAYLNLVDDERQDVYIKVTDGSTSARFRAIRLPLGVGLGGLMVQTATPYATGDYHSDDRFVHGDSVDAAVAEEGVHAILGVPLVLGGRVIGGLLAANRAPRPFPPDEIALATSLAAHAVVALENARLFQSSQTALRELDRARALVQRHAEAVEVAASAHDRLNAVLLHGGDAADVAEVVAEVLGGSVAVLDPDGTVLAAAADVDESLLTAARQVRLSGRTVALDTSDGRLWLAPAIAGSDHLATLVLGEHAELPESDRRVLERAAVVTALLLLFQRSVADAEHRVRGELLADVLAYPERDCAMLRERARRLRANLDDPHAVVVARAEEIDSGRALAAAARLAMDRRGLAALRDGEVVLTLPRVAPTDAARLVVRRLTEVLDCTVTAGGAGPAAGARPIRDAYREAHQCLSTLLALGRRGESADVRGLGYVRLLFGPQEPQDVDAFVHTQLGPLIEHDAQKGSELVNTLEAYFAANRNLNRARTELHVHVNTVAQRLDRITALLGPDWRDPLPALELQLALRLRRLRPTLGDDPD
ncbi:helix-turn-helix domain-containing protein [Actinophytocola sp.]|uniref:helix-turn-helix domain-containing protein n=1 Tax=Actinophytocola sp. TaxID=1872138 RepID=UPI003D6AD1F8